jgi:hypothetical protein
VRDYADRVKRGFEFSDHTLSVEEICDTIRRGESFLERDETAKSHRQVNWSPRFFTRKVRAQDPDEDDGRLRGRLRDFVQQKIKGHQYRIDDVRRRELERIWQTAVRRVK